MSRAAVAMLTALGINLLLLVLLQQLIRYPWQAPQARPADYGAVRWLQLSLPPNLPQPQRDPPQPPQTEPAPVPRQPPAVPSTPRPLAPPRPQPTSPQATAVTSQLPSLESLLARLPDSIPAVRGKPPVTPPPALLENPQARLRIPPEYPTMARRLGIEGEVVVEFTINRAGRVIDPRVIEARPARLFDQAALRAISGWSFAPPEWQGRVVEQKARQRFRFRLQD